MWVHIHHILLPVMNLAGELVLLEEDHRDTLAGTEQQGSLQTDRKEWEVF